MRGRSLPLYIELLAHLLVLYIQYMGLLGKIHILHKTLLFRVGQLLIITQQLLCNSVDPIDYNNYKGVPIIILKTK